MTSARDLRAAATAVATLRKVEVAHARGDHAEVDRLLAGADPYALVNLEASLHAAAAVGDTLVLFQPDRPPLHAA